MERTDRIPQLYGYTVCLVAIVTILFAISSLVRDAFTLADPLHASASEFGFFPNGNGTSLTSFEAYRATNGPREQSTSASDLAGRAVAAPGQAGAAPKSGTVPDTLTTDQQRARYEALRADMISRIHFRGLQSMTSALLTLAIALALFLIHWRWLKQLTTANGRIAATPS